MRSRSLCRPLPITVLTFALSVLASSVFAQSITIGNPPDASSGNSYPFGSSIAAYQQVYAASDFSGPISINGLTFFNTVSAPGTIQTATYNIQLSTTSAAVNGLSNTFANNLGGNNATVFLGTLSGAASPSFTIPTSQFNYNPAGGNLLLSIFKTNITGTANLFADARNGTAAGLFSRKYSLSSSTTADNVGFDTNYGLVTQFNFTSAAATPEPGTWAMFIGMGLSGSLFLKRRKRTIH